MSRQCGIFGLNQSRRIIIILTIELMCTWFLSKKKVSTYFVIRDRRGRDRMVVGFTGRGFICVLRFPPPMKLTATI